MIIGWRTSPWWNSYWDARQVMTWSVRYKLEHGHEFLSFQIKMDNSVWLRWTDSSSEKLKLMKIYISGEISIPMLNRT